MVVSNTIIADIKTQALNAFDSVSHIAFGTGTTTPTSSDTSLGTEVIRKAITTGTRDEVAGTYLFDAVLGLSEGNGNTLAETGTFDADSAGNMSTRNLLTPTVIKTSDIELRQATQVTVEVTLI